MSRGWSAQPGRKDIEVRGNSICKGESSDGEQQSGQQEGVLAVYFGGARAHYCVARGWGNRFLGPGCEQGERPTLGPLGWAGGLGRTDRKAGKAWAGARTEGMRGAQNWNRKDRLGTNRLGGRARAISWGLAVTGHTGHSTDREPGSGLGWGQGAAAGDACKGPPRGGTAPELASSRQSGEPQI